MSAIYGKQQQSSESLPMQYLPVKVEGEEATYADSPGREADGDQGQDEGLLAGNKVRNWEKSPPWSKRELIVMGFSLVGLILGMLALAKAVVFGREGRCGTDGDGNEQGKTGVSYNRNLRKLLNGAMGRRYIELGQNCYSPQYLKNPD